MSNKDLGLNEFLQPENSPITGQGATSGYKFDYSTERGAVRGMQIQDAAITNAKIGTASIGTANIGTLSFNEISGGTARLGGTSNGDGVLNLYNSGGTQISQIDNDGVDFFGPFQAIKFKDITGGTLIGSVELLGGLSFHVDSHNGYNMNLTADDFMFIDSGRAMTLETTDGDLSLIANDSIKLKSSGSANTFQLWAGTADLTYNTITIDANGGTTRITRSGNVAKTAIVETSRGYTALYCIESPQVWFMDFAKVKPRKWYEFWKKEEYEFDPLFIETVESIDHVIPTKNKEIVQVYGIRKGFKTIRFENKTKKQYEKNNDFWKQ